MTPSATSCATDFAWSTTGWPCSLAASTTWPAATASFSEAGISAETIIPAPKATRPAASGAPCTLSWAPLTASWAVPFTEPTAPVAESLVDPAAPDADELTPWALPITLSRMPCMRLRAACLRRSTMADGLTLSCRASTLAVIDSRVCAMSLVSSSVLWPIVRPP